jgi:hypothetical protein
MGWRDSPPYFCAATETARDVAADYDQDKTLLPHPLENISMNLDTADRELLGTITTQLSDPDLSPLQQFNAAVQHPVALAHFFEVYMDDFIAYLQAQSTDELLHVTRALLHAIHDIFPPPALIGSTMEDPISHK